MRQHSLLCSSAAALVAAAVAPTRAPITRSRPSSTRALEGEVKGEVTRVWWQNPHIRYDVAMKMPDGSTESWALLPPGNLPTYRRENWTEQTDPGRLPSHGDGQLGPRRHEEALRDLHQRRHRAPRKAASSAAARTRAPSRRRRPTRTSTTP